MTDAATTDPTTRDNPVSTFGWPILIFAGLVLVGLAQASWGTSDQGIQLGIDGLGGVSAGDAAADAQAIFSPHTLRPALVTVILGAIVFALAACGWWVQRSRPIVAGVAGFIVALVGIGVAGYGGYLRADLTRHLLDDYVVNSPDLPAGLLDDLLDPGWGLIATIVVGAVIAVVGIVVGVTSIRQGRTRATPTG
ncbi:MAG: hypothetical protein QM662_12840 [Gordonia sp. (in: high G+C Gram-positive bacteria)]